MKFQAFIPLLGVVAISASPLAMDGSSKELQTRLFTPSWKVNVAPGSDETVVVNGTVQQVDAYMNKRYPGWSERWANVTSPEDSKELSKRQGGGHKPPNYDSVESIVCYQPLKHANTAWISVGIDYLRSIPRDRHPRMDAGPRECAKVSCDWDAAIIWCNNSREPRVLDSFSDIAMGAEDVTYYCGRLALAQRVSGEAHMIGDWSVMVGGWYCDTDYPKKSYEPLRGHNDDDKDDKDDKDDPGTGE